MVSDTDIAKPDPSLHFGEATEELSEGTGSPPPLQGDVPDERLTRVEPLVAAEKRSVSYTHLTLPTKA